MGAFISFRLFIVRELTAHFLIVKKIVLKIIVNPSISFVILPNDRLVISFLQ